MTYENTIEDTRFYTDGTERQTRIECLEPSCDCEAEYVCTAPDGSKIPVCYKHSLQFAPAKVRSLDADTDQST